MRALLWRHQVQNKTRQNSLYDDVGTPADMAWFAQQKKPSTLVLARGVASPKQLFIGPPCSFRAEVDLAEHVTHGIRVRLSNERRCGARSDQAPSSHAARNTAELCEVSSQGASLPGNRTGAWGRGQRPGECRRSWLSHAHALLCMYPPMC